MHDFKLLDGGLLVIEEHTPHTITLSVPQPEYTRLEERDKNYNRQKLHNICEFNDLKK